MSIFTVKNGTPQDEKNVSGLHGAVLFSLTGR